MRQRERVLVNQKQTPFTCAFEAKPTGGVCVSSLAKHTLICVTCAMAIAVAPMTQAESPPPFPQFEAKRVKPPKAGARKQRITVQISPEDVVRQQAAPPTPTPDPTPDPAAPARTAAYAWFWDKVSPDKTAQGAGRIETALNVLGAGDTPVPTPRLQDLTDISGRWGVDILAATVGTDVSPALVLAVISVESAGKVDAVSRAGAEGLMQLMPDTAKRFGVSDSFLGRQNITGGVKYLHWLMQEFDRDPILVLAGYNAGEGAVRKHAGVPPFAETRDYVPKVLAAYSVARGLCLTPPELASDGCVFAALGQ